MAFVKISLIACLLAAVNAQYSVAPVAPTVAYAPHVAVPVAHVPVAHVPVAHVAHVPVAHPFVRILSQSQDIGPDGSYSFSYQSEDGSARSESGTPRAAAQPGVESFGGVAAQGSYSYTSPEGIPVEVQYTADENGYQPSGSGVHPAIVKAVEEQVAQARAEGPIPPAPVAKVAHYAPVAHVPVAHYAPVAHVPVAHYAPVAHVPVAHYAPVAHVPYVSATAAPYYSTTIGKK